MWEWNNGNEGPEKLRKAISRDGAKRWRAVAPTSPAFHLSRKNPSFVGAPASHSQKLDEQNTELVRIVKEDTLVKGAK